RIGQSKFSGSVKKVNKSKPNEKKAPRVASSTQKKATPSASQSPLSPPPISLSSPSSPKSSWFGIKASLEEVFSSMSKMPPSMSFVSPFGHKITPPPVAYLIWHKHDESNNVLELSESLKKRSGIISVKYDATGCIEMDGNDDNYEYVDYLEEDHNYGNEPDCECPYLWKHPSVDDYSNNSSSVQKKTKAQVTDKKWLASTTSPTLEHWTWNYKKCLLKLSGYFSERELRHRCCFYSYLKASRKASQKEFWKTFQLDDVFRVELQLLCVHLWIIKTRMLVFPAPIAHQLAYEVFKILFHEVFLFVYFVWCEICYTKFVHWENNCQIQCLNFACALDDAIAIPSDSLKNESWNGEAQKAALMEVIWREIYMRNSGTDEHLLHLWVQYIANEINRLKRVSDLNFINGWWTFGKIPTNIIQKTA
ncbi:hypothetical protein RFI_23288, partial [Reticulomyxa filosa]